MTTGDSTGEQEDWLSAVPSRGVRRKCHRSCRARAAGATLMTATTEQEERLPLLQLEKQFAGRQVRGTSCCRQVLLGSTTEATSGRNSESVTSLKATTNKDEIVDADHDGALAKTAARIISNKIKCQQIIISSSSNKKKKKMQQHDDNKDDDDEDDNHFVTNANYSQTSSLNKKYSKGSLLEGISSLSEKKGIISFLDSSRSTLSSTNKNIRIVEEQQLGARRRKVIPKAPTPVSGEGALIETQIIVKSSMTNCDKKQTQKVVALTSSSSNQQNNSTYHVQSVKSSHQASNPLSLTKEQKLTCGRESKRAQQLAIGNRYHLKQVGASASMWPSWRQVLILSFASILLTSLLATFNAIFPSVSLGLPFPSSSSCTIFNQCHALALNSTTRPLRVSAQQQHQQQVGMRTSSAPSGTASLSAPTPSSSLSATSSLPRIVSAALELLPAERATGVRLSGVSSSSSSSSSSSNHRPSGEETQRFRATTSPASSNQIQQRIQKQPDYSITHHASSSSSAGGNWTAEARKGSFHSNRNHNNNDFHHSASSNHHQLLLDHQNNPSELNKTRANNNNNEALNDSEQVDEVVLGHPSVQAELHQEQAAELHHHNHHHHHQTDQSNNNNKASPLVPMVAPTPSSSSSAIKLIAAPSFGAAASSSTASSVAPGSAIGGIQQVAPTRQRFNPTQGTPSPVTQAPPATNGFSTVTAAASDSDSPANWLESSRMYPKMGQATNVTRSEQLIAHKQRHNNDNINNNANSINSAQTFRAAATGFTPSLHSSPPPSSGLNARNAQLAALSPELVRGLLHFGELIAAQQAVERHQQLANAPLIDPTGDPTGILVGPADHHNLLPVLAAAQQQQQQFAAAVASATSALGSAGKFSTGTRAQPKASQKSHNKQRAPISSMAQSASAPSISLPPLTHLMVPRNPFRLFSSSSAPSATRYRPSFLPSKSAKHQSKQQQQQQASGSNSKAFTPTSPVSISYDPQLLQLASFWQQQSLLPPHSEPSKAFQGGAQIYGFDDSSQLFAHPHSAEQLERLVKAASQASGFHTPILPAIVSAPGGTFPGLYIPAIESESEAPLTEFRQHGDQLAQHSSSSSQLSSSSGQTGSLLSIMSKIPGTDYILHPDEVRAMINIGESAWRNQQQQQQHQASEQRDLFARPPSSQLQQQQQRQQQQWRTQSAPEMLMNNLMYEDHAANIRDFAYTDTQQANRGATGSNLQQQQNASNVQSYQQQPIPDMIRVNNRDYIHWPILQGSKMNGQQAGRFIPVLNAGSNSFQQASSSNRRPEESSPSQMLTMGPIQAAAAAMPNLSSAQGSAQLISSSGSATSGADSLRNNQQQQNFQGEESSSGQQQVEPNSPVRLATQLTPNEINQVEQSIIEALLLNQQHERQRKIQMHQMALAANINQPVYLHPTGFRVIKPKRFARHHLTGVGNSQWQPIGSNNNVDDQQQKSNKGSGKDSNNRGGFFGRRRRRNSQNTQKLAGRKRKSQQQLLAAASSPQLIIAPTDLIPIHFHHPSTYLQPVIARFLAPAHLDLGSTTAASEALAVFSAPLANHRSRLQRRLAVLLADQDTNKPVISDRRSDSGSSESETDSNRLPVLSAHSPRLPSIPARQLTSSSPANCSSQKALSPFGSRVGSGVSGCSLATPKGEASPPQKRQQLSPQTLSVSAATSVPQRSTRPADHRGRVVVDWPGMVSDADYFPPASMLPSSHHHSSASSNSPKFSHHRPAHHQQQAPSENRLKNHATPATPFVPSQLKLQFAQDYQAREGVPIYNNNVRVAGALDRRQASLQQLNSATRLRNGFSNAKSESESETEPDFLPDSDSNGTSSEDADFDESRVVQVRPQNIPLQIKETQTAPLGKSLQQVPTLTTTSNKLISS